MISCGIRGPSFRIIYLSSFWEEKWLVITWKTIQCPQLPSRWATSCPGLSFTSEQISLMPWGTEWKTESIKTIPWLPCAHESKTHGRAQLLLKRTKEHHRPVPDFPPWRKSRWWKDAQRLVFNNIRNHKLQVSHSEPVIKWSTKTSKLTPLLDKVMRRALQFMIS